jgi:hypothetical protein
LKFNQHGGSIDGNPFAHNTSGAIIIADILQGDGGPGAASMKISNTRILNSPANTYNGHGSIVLASRAYALSSPL